MRQLTRLLENLRSPDHAADLIILDDIFPHLLSSFRIAEFNAYLSAFEDSRVYSTGAAFPAVGERRSFQEVNDEYGRRYPELSGRTFQFRAGARLRAKLIYFVFLQNARTFMSFLTRTQAPFVFTLYPGGGFQMNEPHSDETLRMVCALPNLRKVITTQKVTREYLRNFLDPDRIEFIYGGVFPSNQFAHGDLPRKFYQQDKDTLDICFVAFKYMARGIDKGYDLFIDVARTLCRRHPDIRFHVVGPFDDSEIDVSDLNDRITFYGVRNTHFLAEFYSRMDLILAPNVPFTLMPGAFDGFPTGSCIEAGLAGVPVFCTDILQQNTAFKEGEEFVNVPRSVARISELISNYRSNYDELMEIGRRGQQAFKREFDIEKQMRARIDILSPLLA